MQHAERDELSGWVEPFLVHKGQSAQAQELVMSGWFHFFVQDNLPIMGVWDALSEMTSNALEKGALKVTVHVHNGIILVEDDVCHTFQEQEVLLKKLAQPKVRSTKNRLGGVGIAASRKYLAELDGSLDFVGLDDGRIVAVIRWPQTHIETADEMLLVYDETKKITDDMESLKQEGWLVRKRVAIEGGGVQAEFYALERRHSGDA